MGLGVAHLASFGIQRRSLAEINNMIGCSLEESQQLAAKGFTDLDIFEGLRHVCHPGITFSMSNPETRVRLAQAQPPPPLRVLARSAENQIFHHAPGKRVSYPQPSVQKCDPIDP